MYALYFKASGENFNQPITILLTKEIMQELNLYELKGLFSYGLQN